MNKDRIFSRIIFSVLSIVLLSLRMSGQPVGNVDILLFDSLSIQKLDELGILSDYVSDGGHGLFVEYVKDGHKHQYFRSSDTSYYYRSYDTNVLYEEGPYTFGPKSYCCQDTFLDSCTEELHTVSQYHLLKHGKWRIETPGGESFLGKYVYGEKDGEWVHINFKREKRFLNYATGRLQRLTLPYSFEIREFMQELKGQHLFIAAEDWKKPDRIVITAWADDITSKYQKSYEVEIAPNFDLWIRKPGHSEVLYRLEYHNGTYRMENDEAESSFMVSEIGRNGLTLKK